MGGPATPTALPVLDAGAFRADPASPDATRFVDDLRAVCHDTGFFYLVGHGVDDELNADIHRVTREFFALPDADRMEIASVNSPQFRGYTPVGHEYTQGRPDRRDEIDIGYELPEPRLGPDDPPWLRLRGPNQWPAMLPELRTTVTVWMTAMEALGCTVLQALALALGQPVEHFDECVTPHPEVLVKLIRYPAAPVALPCDHQDGDDQGVGEHRDTGLLTFVHQDAVAGLQVKLGDGFVDIPQMPGAYVVNLGEMMQLLTHGYFAATIHRVVSPPPGSERVSAAYFFNPKLEATLTPLTLPPELAAAAPGGASADPTNPILANYGENSLKVRLRAHPDVARRHHADLLAATSDYAPRA